MGVQCYVAQLQAGLMGDCEAEDEAVECVPDILIPDNLADQLGAEETLLKIKSVAYRTDMGALDKINRIKGLLERSGEEDTDRIGENGGVKRKNEEEVIDCPKAKTGKDGDGCMSEEDTADCCPVCGLRLEVFQHNPVREVQHYLSHGFTPLKEFNVLKSDDSLFFCCNLCDQVYPRRIGAPLIRKHIVTVHAARVVDMFRDI